MTLPKSPDDSAIRKSWIEWPCTKSKDAMAMITGIRIRLSKAMQEPDNDDEEVNRVADLYYIAERIKGLLPLIEALSKEKKESRQARAEKFRKAYAMLRKKLAKAAEFNGISPAVLGIEEIRLLDGQVED